VARAWAAAPEVLLADEPTPELDPERRALVLTLMRDHARKVNIVILASHDQNVVDSAERTLALVDGRPRRT
jgi:ABC-type lipoprotein export system ATPase subunit